MIKKDEITVIICCAGMGTRLGIGNTKALIDIGGEPLIVRQLKLLDEFDDVRIVVGFGAENIINVVKEIRKDVVFVFNYEYKYSGPADSLKKALLGSRKYIITMDGDTIINPTDFKKFIDFQNECIAVTKDASYETIGAVVQNGMVENLTNKVGNAQWSGIAKVCKDKLCGSSSYVYELLVPHLPMVAFPLRLKEINVPEDYENALDWFSNKNCDE